MLKEFMTQLEKELLNRDHRINGIEFLGFDKRRRRVYFSFFVHRVPDNETCLPVAITMDYYLTGNIQAVAGFVLQAAGLGTWGPRDYRKAWGAAPVMTPVII